MIGALNQRGILLQRVSQADGGGGYTECWQHVGALWLKLTLQSTGQDTGADGVQTKITYKVTIRRREDVTAGMRLQLGGRLFDILAQEDCGEPTVTLICEALP